MTRTWVLRIIGVVLLGFAGVGFVGLIGGGNCGCSDPNYVCSAPPCPASDGLWFVFVFAGMFLGITLLTVSSFTAINDRSRRWQRAHGPVVAERATGPVAFPNMSSLMPRPSFSTPDVSVPGQSTSAPATDASQPFGGALGGFGGASGGGNTGGAGESDRLSELAQLNSLRQSGAITQSEYDEQKRKLLGES
ncbi:MAG: SHOCT domain-containing protein [Candidatus Dormibacteraeota bacterium]|nr:SHOCT domain-containing protein [Candidatus Dormibacteraeota bacterium]